MTTTNATPTTPAEVQSLVDGIEARPGYGRPAAWGFGLASFGSSGAVLDTYYPVPQIDQGWLAWGLIWDELQLGDAGLSGTRTLSRDQLQRVVARLAPVKADGRRHPVLRALEAAAAAPAEGQPLVRREPVVTAIRDLQAKPVDAHDVYLRLHLLSHRKVQPHSLNLEGMFGLLTNVVWTNLGPFEVGDFELVRWHMRAQGLEVLVHGLDKFPRMTDYVIPSGVRIADANRVRLGAHLAEGTTVMHEGFVNFNAGTLGASMVEGRISAGVVVGNGSDVGGGASIMGTLSGGGKEVIRVGEGSLIGANAGIGISLGNGCTVEAGLYVTAGSRVTLPDGRVVKAVELSGQDDLLFRRNSVNGNIEVVAKKNQVVLNEALHQNA